MSRSSFRFLLSAVLILLILAGLAAFWAYRQVYQPNVSLEESTRSLYIEKETSMESLQNLLVDSNYIKDPSSFKRVAAWMSFSDRSIKPGHYLLEDGWSNRLLISTIRTGRQSPVKLILNNERSLEAIAGTTGKYLQADSSEIFHVLVKRNWYDSLGIPYPAALSLFIPNTYEFYWTTGPIGFMHRMIREHDRFWTTDRLSKCNKIGLEPEEVYTLASIVERETLKNEEKDRIAGVYLNRLEKGIMLQADPTVVFAHGDFTIKRVLNRHLTIDSPYNTYLYAGLPPGPICMPSISSIEGVLNAEKHDYLFFCARADKPGYHAFAKTLAGHNQNARRYQAWLSQQGIR